MDENDVWERLKGCVFYESALTMLLMASDGQAGQAVKAAAAYSLYGEEPELTDEAAMLIRAVLNIDVERSLQRYRKTCEKNRLRFRREEQEEDELPLPCGG